MNDVNWAALIALGVMAIGALNAWIAYLASKTKAKTVETEAKVVEVKAKVIEVKEAVAEVKTLVDGPLSVALRSNADLARKLANETGRPEDALAAEKAEAINKNRAEGKNE